MAVLEEMEREARELLKALERGDREAVGVAQRRFSQIITEAWDRYQRGEIEVAVRGLPRVMYQWAMEELPRQVEDPARWPEVRRELARFLRTVQWVVEPEEKG
ncbi:MAG TPA: hypothetical protein G4O00_05750 [Thermoflexia bacterium]|jgi:hypothetical protein|nr:hypothetical protein [Thermoflexia bacterium]